MNYIFETPICVCGSKSAIVHSQEYVAGQSTTLEERLLKNLEPDNLQPCVYIPDWTNTQCARCKAKIGTNDFALMRAAMIASMEPNRKSKGWVVREEKIGQGIINIRGLKGIL